MASKQSDKARTLAVQSAASVIAFTAAEQAFLDFQDAFQEFMDLPYLPKTAAAKEGITFDALKIGERDSENPETGEIQPQWLILAELHNPCELEMKNGDVRFFEGGEKVLVSVNKNGVRDKVVSVLRDILKSADRIENLALQEIPAKKALQSNPIVLTHGSRWMSLADYRKAHNK